MERTDEDLERETMARVTWRLIPFMGLLYLFAILDRFNIGVAVLTMKPDLGFSDRVYGFGAGIFFVGYFFFEVPSNIMLEKLGARIWIARIMMTWGVVASCMMFITRDPLVFYAMRFLLGVAEAGFFPGMMLYLTYWFPNAVRSRAAAKFVVSNVFASIIGGPLGAQLMKLNGVGGLRGWQWLFLLEGIPAVLLGFAVLMYMTDRPEKAHWLTAEQKGWLIKKLASEREQRQKHHHMTLAEAFRYPRVLHLSALFFFNILAGSGLGVFSNLLMQQRSGWNNETVLWASAIPGIVGAIAVLTSAVFSDRTGERRLFVCLGLAIASIGVFIVATAGNGPLTLVGLCVAAIGGNIANAPFWALTTGFLSGAAAAGGIAFINSIGNSGSFFSPILMGDLKERFHAYEPALFILAGIYVLASLVAFFLPPDPAQQKAG